MADPALDCGAPYRVINRRTGRVLADRAASARSFLARARGLLGRVGLRAGEGLWIDPCPSIHMFFMRFAIDAAFVDRAGRVTRAISNLRPWRIASGGRGARSVLELPVGTIEASGTRVGDELEFALTDAGEGSSPHGAPPASPPQAS